MPLPADTSAPGGPSGSSSATPTDTVDKLVPKLEQLGNDDEEDGDDASDDEADDVNDAGAPGAGGDAAAKKKKNKKKKKKSKGKAADTAPVDPQQDLINVVRDNMAAGDSNRVSNDDIRKALQAMDLMKLLEAQGNPSNSKALGEHKFWKTQPVPQTEGSEYKEGPIDEPKTPADVRQEPLALPAGFVWSTMDVKNEEQMLEVHTLLTENYVEDDDAMFRFRYTKEFLLWALTPPGYEEEWHIGVRVQKTGKLVGFISGIKIEIRAREKTFDSAEINFLCVHKKLRSKRLAPVLIKEVTRRVNLTNIWQAIYTAGVVIPTPFATCRYYHRNLNPPKLVDIGFSPLPRGQTIARLVRQYAVGTATSTPGFREMVADDVPQVATLLRRYLARFPIMQTFSKDEDVMHWFISGLGREENGKRVEQVVWAYVVEDPTTHEITDMVSFYCLPSTIMQHPKHDVLNAAYMYYYASDVVFSAGGSGEDSDQHKVKVEERLNALIRDLMVMAQTNGFDVLNALTLMDNNMFLNQQQFGPGDGYLVCIVTNPDEPANHDYLHYLYNWSTAPIDGGLNTTAKREGSGVGVVML
ncbi:glycylpeptide N-tetradecanoyltransferase [Apiotrichum porosum]|uniref:Glycylpeptide N-tetradecanoyltransferase n=1 Tax=Apiotrichum porosum TaxID=105984 RepID=A0A427XKB3_9TREE|nr:glycylpeptide N-tetradecanoyltransferase [Apiotrichum porosum]RSH79232.1 glycylpeptide N-tetradecanoyltransferase [Apiotrichum porosum]